MFVYFFTFYPHFSLFLPDFAQKVTLYMEGVLS